MASEKQSLASELVFDQGQSGHKAIAAFDDDHCKLAARRQH